MTDALGGATPGEPVHGWKVGIVWWTGAGLRLSGIGGPRDGSVADRLYDVDDRARCARGGHHDAPHERCTCGFWSVVERVELGTAFSRVDRAWADLEIESFGRIVVHERGLRSERQRVLAVVVDDRCVECGREATLLGADKPGAVTPRCGIHAPSRVTGWCANLADAAADLGTEVRRGRRPWTPSAPADRHGEAARRRRSAPRTIAGALTVLALAVPSLGALASRAVSGPSATLDTSPVVAAQLAEHADAGGPLGAWVALGGRRWAVDRIWVAGELRGAAAHGVDPSGATSCVLAVREPVPAFTAEALLPGDAVVGAWRVAEREGATAADCLRWRDDVAAALGRAG